MDWRTEQKYYFNKDRVILSSSRDIVSNIFIFCTTLVNTWVPYDWLHGNNCLECSSAADDQDHNYLIPKYIIVQVMTNHLPISKHLWHLNYSLVEKQVHVQNPYNTTKDPNYAQGIMFF